MLRPPPRRTQHPPSCGLRRRLWPPSPSCQQPESEAVRPCRPVGDCQDLRRGLNSRVVTGGPFSRDLAASGRRADRRCRAVSMLAAVLAVVLSSAGPVLPAPRPTGVPELEAPAAPSGMPADVLDPPAPADVGDVPAVSSRDVLTSLWTGASDLPADGRASRWPTASAGKHTPPAPGEVHRVELLPRPPPELASP